MPSTSPLPQQPPTPGRPPLPPTPPAPDAPDLATRPVHDELDTDGACLAEALDLLDAHDRIMTRLVVQLATIKRGRLTKDRAGMDVEAWLQHAGRLRRTDARRLIRVAHDLERLPRTTAALADGHLSFSQAQQIAAASRRIGAAHREELDIAVAAMAPDARRYEPDALLDAVWQFADTANPSVLEQAEAQATRNEFVQLTPFLFGGGSIYGEFGPEHFAMLCEALDAPLAAPTLDQAATQDLTPEELDRAVDELDALRARLARSHGADMAERLTGLAQQWLARPAPLAGDNGDAPPPAPRPTVFLTMTADSLLADDRIPGHLLTTLMGGRMRVSSKFGRDLVDARGADLRGIVLDDVGEVVGVGRKTRVPPGWLREAIWARDLTDRTPQGRTPVRRCDLDHIIPWSSSWSADRPPGTDSTGPPGRTDVDNLHPVGRRGHTGKTSGQWAVDRAPDRATTWTHSRTGSTITRPPPRLSLN